MNHFNFISPSKLYLLNCRLLSTISITAKGFRITWLGQLTSTKLSATSSHHLVTSLILFPQAVTTNHLILTYKIQFMYDNYCWSIQVSVYTVLKCRLFALIFYFISEHITITESFVWQLMKTVKLFVINFVCVLVLVNMFNSELWSGVCDVIIARAIVLKTDSLSDRL